jgi:hypothetical protein
MHGTVLAYASAGQAVHSGGASMSTEYYLDGDPAIDSTRRHLERVLNQPQPRRWPWLFAMLAGGAAFTFWRARSKARKPDAGSASVRRSS